MLQRANDAMIGATAVDAVAHSEGNGAPAQDPEEGAISRRRAAGSCCRPTRDVLGVGAVSADMTKMVMTANEAIILPVVLDAFESWRFFDAR